VSTYNRKELSIRMPAFSPITFHQGLYEDLKVMWVVPGACHGATRIAGLTAMSYHQRARGSAGTCPEWHISALLE